LQVPDLELTPITDPSLYPEVIHGTYSKCWDSIKSQVTIIGGWHMVITDVAIAKDAATLCIENPPSHHSIPNSNWTGVSYIQWLNCVTVSHPLLWVICMID
jgi:hypothetical protein